MPADLLNQTLLGQYRVDAFLGLTPLGETYRAWDFRLNRRLAITILPAELTSPEALKALETRLPALQKINGPALTPFHGLHQSGLTAFITEDFIDGPTLRDVLNSQPGQSFSLSETITYAKAISAALDAIHKAGFVHLSLAPEQIRIGKDGKIHLAGLWACLPADEPASLRPGPFPAIYAAPEQFQAAPSSPTADTYALASMLFELFTGRWLARKSEESPSPLELDPETIRRAHTFLLPPAPRNFNPELPDYLSRTLLKALSKRENERFSRANELFLTLCMAARLDPLSSPDSIAPDVAAVTHNLLQSWRFLPPIEPRSVPRELTPLKENVMAAVKTPSRRFQLSDLIRPLGGLALFGAVIFLLWQIKPIEQQVYLPGEPNIRAENFTPFPTPTRPPKPTAAHGGRIIFTCTRGDYNQLCRVNADGTELGRITRHAAHDYYPGFAPQGDMIVFASNQNGYFDLFLMFMKDGRQIQLTEGIGNVVSPDFSPDGQKIVFANRAADGPTAIWVVDNGGVNPKLLYAGPNTIVATAWSPDGLTIAYCMAVDQPDAYEVFLMDTDGKNHRRITQGLPGIGGSLDWSPDGTNLLIYAGPAGDKNIYRLDVATGQATQLTSGGNNAASSYSPDGQWIAFNSLRNNGQADIFVMRADGSNLRQITKDPEPDWQPRWQP